MSDLYDRWISYVFDRRPAANAWYFAAEPFDATSVELTHLFIETCRRSGADLRAFNDQQVNEGLSYLFNNACSDVPFALKDASVALSVRVEAIHSIGALYRDCFEARCTSTLAHLDEPNSSPLNHICYMLWDVSPLVYWEGNPEGPAFHAAILELLESTLRSPNVACIESALHGLGHLHLYQAKPVERIVSRWLSDLPSTERPALIAYAKAARAGHVQ